MSAIKVDDSRQYVKKKLTYRKNSGFYVDIKEIMLD